MDKNRFCACPQCGGLVLFPPADRVQSALRELVDLKTAKDKIESLTDGLPSGEADCFEREYPIRKAAAWKKAREALDAANTPFMRYGRTPSRHARLFFPLEFLFMVVIIGVVLAAASSLGLALAAVFHFIFD